MQQVFRKYIMFSFLTKSWCLCGSDEMNLARGS